MNALSAARRRVAPLSLVSISLCLSLAACAPVDVEDPSDAGGEEREPRTSFVWETHEVDGLVAGWGSVFASSGARSGFLVGGVDGTEGPVTGRVLEVNAGDDVSASESALISPRYCGCALYDENRGELVAIGGRTFSAEVRDAVVIDDAGAAASVGDVGPGDAPIGCVAMFFPSLDRGYIFGGRGQTSGMSGTTWRYDPATREFTAIDATGPSARYDAASKNVDDETAIVVGGMGVGPLGAVFPSDVWMFDGASEEWSAIDISGVTPPGRREPWVALGPDDDTLLMGFGSDRGDGTSALGDLWRLSLSSGTWQQLEVELPDDVIAPPARGFTAWMPGPEGSAGLLFGGYDGASVIPDAPLALWPPDELAGEWR